MEMAQLAFFVDLCYLMVVYWFLQQLEQFGIPVPRYALVNRDYPNQELDYFIEEEDFVEVHGNRFWKPFVEKPVDGTIVIQFMCYTLVNLRLVASRKSSRNV